MMTTSFLGALLAPSLGCGLTSIELRISFEAVAEPIPVIVQRLAEELDRPLATAQKLSGERLVIVAPSVDGQDLLDQIAYALFAEWREQPDGTLLLDRLPAGEREQEKVGNLLLGSTGEFNRPESIERLAQPLTREAGDEWAENFIELANRFKEEPTETMPFMDMARLTGETPTHRLMARMLMLLPDEFWSLPGELSEGESIPDAVISTQPSSAEVSARAIREDLLQGFRADQQAWQQMVAHHALEQMLPDSSNPWHWNFRSMLGMDNRVPQAAEPADFALTVSRTPEGVSVMLYTFRADGSLSRSEPMSFRSEASQAQTNAWQELQASAEQWVLPGEVMIPLPTHDGRSLTYGELLARPDGFDQLLELMFTVGRASARALNRPVIFPPVTPEFFLASRQERFDLSEFLVTWQMLHLLSDEAPDTDAIRYDEEWVVMRRFGGPGALYFFGWAEFDHAAIQEAFVRVQSRGQAELLDYVQLAGAVNDPFNYQQLLYLMAQLTEAGMSGFFNRAAPGYSEAKLLAELIQNDPRRLETGARRTLGQLSPAGREAVRTWVYASDFVIPADVSELDLLREGIDPRDILAQQGLSRRLQRMPTQVFPDGIPSQAQITLQSFDRYAMESMRTFEGRQVAQGVNLMMYALNYVRSEQTNLPFAFENLVLRVNRVHRMSLSIGEHELSREFITPGQESTTVRSLDDFPDFIRIELQRLIEEFRQTQAPPRPEDDRETGEPR